MNKLRKAERCFVPDFILIASSTGGPYALREVIQHFSLKLKPPILVVQHMPPKFTEMLAESLNVKSHFFAKEAAEGDLIRIQSITVAKGGNQMVLKRRGEYGQIRLTEEVGKFGLRPSADVFFQSVAESYPNSKVLTIVLTGMGSDGRQGLVELNKACQCYTIVQDEESSVVWGMPGSVYEAGLANEALPLNEIGKRVNELLML